MTEKTRILIADDHPLIRRGLWQMIEAETNFEIVAEAADGQQALNLLLKHQPQIGILDISMPGLGGFDVARELQKHKLPVAIVFLTIQIIHAVNASRKGARSSARNSPAICFNGSTARGCSPNKCPRSTT